MTDEAYPVAVGDDILYLRFDDIDGKEIERELSFLVAFHPKARTYENAALFAWHGCRRRNETGDLVYAFPQTKEGRDQAFQWVKQFCCQFEGVMGIALLYAFIEKALIVAGWFPEKKPEDGADTKEEVPVQPEGEPGKNVLPPTRRLLNRLHSAFAGLRSDSSGE